AAGVADLQGRAPDRPRRGPRPRALAAGRLRARRSPRRGEGVAVHHRSPAPASLRAPSGNRDLERAARARDRSVHGVDLRRLRGRRPAPLVGRPPGPAARPLRRAPMASSRIAIKRVYDEASPDDGTRVLIMRLWPRGIRKDRVDTWLRELGPVVELLRAFRGGTIDWDEYRRRYLAGLSRPEANTQIAEVRELARAGRVTLLCGCPDEERCHRSFLRGFLTKRRGTLTTVA